MSARTRRRRGAEKKKKKKKAEAKAGEEEEKKMEPENVDDTARRLFAEVMASANGGRRPDGAETEPTPSVCRRDGVLCASAREAADGVETGKHSRPASRRRLTSRDGVMRVKDERR